MNNEEISVPNTENTVPNLASQKPPIAIKIKKKVVFIGIAIVMLVLGIVLYIYSTKQMDPKSSGKTVSDQSFTPGVSQKPIVKVGEEYIYQKDLDQELAHFPGAKDANTKKLLVNKLVKDSIVLQAAKKNKLVTLDNTVYNSTDKDYAKRIAQMKSIEKKITNSVDHISGSMVSVWFNNYVPAKIGVVKGKQVAFEKISALQKRVVNKEISIEDAGKLISSDASYADLDIGYQNNAFIPFTYHKGDAITIDSNFDTILWNSKPGEVTGVYLGKSIDYKTRKEIESYYVFGQVKEKIDKGNTTDFATWYEANKKDYEIIYY